MLRFELGHGWAGGVGARLLGLGLLLVSACFYSSGATCGPNCCSKTAECQGGKTCRYGECRCLDGMVDCGTGVCVPGPCPTCTDGVENGAETAIDCGGSGCPPCTAGQG